jgi:hypothetical protein
MHMGDMLRHRTKLDEAREHYAMAVNFGKEKVQRLGGSLILMFDRLGEVLIELGEYEEAYTVFQQQLSYSKAPVDIALSTGIDFLHTLF